MVIQLTHHSLGTVANVIPSLAKGSPPQPNQRNQNRSDRAARDDFFKAIREHGQASEAVIAHSKTELQTQWAKFESSVSSFLNATDQQAKEQEAAFRARADAQRKAWKEAIDKLHSSAKNFADNRREEVETAVKHMKVDADAARAKLEKLRKSGSESWAAMQSVLTETRAAWDKANQAVHESLKRAA
ncbi:hypothetical protein [Hyphomicrobium sp. 99]|uniref:hypothetical protein n=1 Tax=Hyphomicrobium sp. 99 TaxID=1163419 RepID=UPI00069791F0|nr:hypothetical protein [Hyphomicrobium sp. 99]